MKYDFTVYCGTTGIRLDHDKGFEPYNGEGYMFGRFIHGGWQDLAKAEEEGL